MKRIFALFFLVLMGCVSMAQKNITINGATANAAGKHVELYRYSDRLSLQEIMVDEMTIGEDGKFRLECYANYPMLVFVQMDNYSQSFYVEPGREYSIWMGNFDWNQDERRNVYLDPVTLPLEFLNLPKDDLNVLIDRFDAAVDGYIASHREHFDERFRPQKRYFDSLQIAVEKQCPDVEGNDYFNRYKRFQLAELKLNLKMESRKNIYRQYIKDSPVRCWDDNYMGLFTTLYSHAISDGTKAIPVERLEHWVNNLDLATYIDSLGVDPMLRHEQVRELAALIALKEAYYNAHFYEDSMVVKMIERIGQRTKFQEHKPIVANILSSLHQAQAGTAIRSYELPDVDKQMVDLDSMKGKWVYMAFVRVDDPNCIGELETMAHFRDTVYAQSDSIEFVTIVCDREFQKMYHFLKNSKKDHRYPWTWLHFGGDYDMLRQFEVVSYPTFVLIDPEGNRYYNITPAPSTGYLMHPVWQPRPRIEERRSILIEY